MKKIFAFIFLCGIFLGSRVYAVELEKCHVENPEDSNVAFLDYIVETSFTAGEAMDSVDLACNSIDYFGERTGEFGHPLSKNGPPLNEWNDMFMSLTWNNFNRNLVSEVSESREKQEEMQEKHPDFISRLNSFTKEADPWKRMKLTYEYITEISKYDREHKSDLSGNDPVESVRRAEAGKPIGVCRHYASLLDFALTYVGGGPRVSKFDVSMSGGNGHAWNSISFEMHGKNYRFDLDATMYKNFLPLSSSYWDTTLPFIGTRNNILKECRKIKKCLQEKEDQNGGLVSRHILLPLRPDSIRPHGKAGELGRIYSLKPRICVPQTNSSAFFDL